MFISKICGRTFHQIIREKIKSCVRKCVIESWVVCVVSVYSCMCVRKKSCRILSNMLEMNHILGLEKSADFEFGCF